jgi:tetratricopeptide (TPR) repeat protein
VCLLRYHDGQCARTGCRNEKTHGQQGRSATVSSTGAGDPQRTPRAKAPATATAINKLGALLDGLGNKPAARKTWEEALAIRMEVLGEKHTDAATSLNNLVHLLIDLGDYAAAWPCLEHALAIK